jgi:RHS repeat-associated protein
MPDGGVPILSMSHYVKDHLGSTRVVLDEQMQPSGVYAYAAYGMEKECVASPNHFREKFTGKELDNEGTVNGAAGIRLSYFGKRYYDAEIGSWTSTDAAEQYHSLYTYSSNNPINFIDPNGKWGVHIHAIGSFIGARRAGEGYWSSTKIAYNAVIIDTDHPKGLNVLSNVERHAIQMNGENIGRAEALTRTDKYVDRMILNPSEGSRSKRLGYASHASSDKYIHAGMRLDEHDNSMFVKESATMTAVDGIEHCARETQKVVDKAQSIEKKGN